MDPLALIEPLDSVGLRVGRELQLELVDHGF